MGNGIALPNAECATRIAEQGAGAKNIRQLFDGSGKVSSCGCDERNQATLGSEG